jgi:hypothetical protein
MHNAMKLSFHAGKLSVPCSFSMDRRLLGEDSEEERGDDMIAKEGEGEGREEREREKGNERRERGQQTVNLLKEGDEVYGK